MSGVPWEPEVVYDRMMEVDGDTINLQIDRAHPEDNLFVSKDALDALHHEVMLWVGSRMMRKHAATGKAPQSIDVQVRVTLDGETQPFTLPINFDVLDGSIRASIATPPEEES